MEQDAGETAEVSLLELVRRASTEGDLQAWTAVQYSLQATALAWLRAHPGRALACAEQDEQFLIERVFAEAWQAVRQEPLAYDSLSQLLLLLRASLNGVILEARRVSSSASIVGADRPAGGEREGHRQSQQTWRWLYAKLSGERERRLAYLLYHCGLQPAEIVRRCPQEWSDIHEVIRLRRIIFTTLVRKSER